MSRVEVGAWPRSDISWGQLLSGEHYYDGREFTSLHGVAAGACLSSIWSRTVRFGVPRSVWTPTKLPHPNASSGPSGKRSNHKQRPRLALARASGWSQRRVRGHEGHGPRQKRRPTRLRGEQSQEWQRMEPCNVPYGLATAVPAGRDHKTFRGPGSGRELKNVDDPWWHPTVYWYMAVLQPVPTALHCSFWSFSQLETPLVSRGSQ